LCGSGHGFLRVLFLGLSVVGLCVVLGLVFCYISGCVCIRLLGILRRSFLGSNLICSLLVRADFSVVGTTFLDLGRSLVGLALGDIGFYLNLVLVLGVR